MKKQWLFWSIIFYCVAYVDAAFPFIESSAMSSKALCTAIQQQMSSHILSRRLQRLPQKNLETETAIGGNLVDKFLI